MCEEPKTYFNFAIDTLYFDKRYCRYVQPFLLSLIPDEMDNIQYIVIDIEIKLYREDGDDKDPMLFLRDGMKLMPSPKEVNMVCKIDTRHKHHSQFPRNSSHTTPTQLMSSWSPDMLQYLSYKHDCQLVDKDECLKLPNMGVLLRNMKIPAKGGVLWGWRPVDLSFMIV